LLTLILADGQRLVTHVMPSALLEQSRNILRDRFAAIIVKQVSLSFVVWRAVDFSAPIFLCRCIGVHAAVRSCRRRQVNEQTKRDNAIHSLICFTVEMCYWSYNRYVRLECVGRRR
jgi:uncharacterized membrane protein YhfC